MPRAISRKDHQLQMIQNDAGKMRQRLWAERRVVPSRDVVKEGREVCAQPGKAGSVQGTEVLENERGEALR